MQPVTLRTIPVEDGAIKEYHFMNHSGSILIAVTFINFKHNLLDTRLLQRAFLVLLILSEALSVHEETFIYMLHQQDHSDG
jgi:hypothetical protein